MRSVYSRVREAISSNHVISSIHTHDHTPFSSIHLKLIPAEHTYLRHNYSGLEKNMPEQSDEAIYFWRETEIPYGFLCQWFPSSFSHEGQKFNCAEQWMMWAKAKFFEDEETAKKVLGECRSMYDVSSTD